MKKIILVTCTLMVISCSLNSQNNVGVFFFPMMDYEYSQILKKYKTYYDGFAIGIRSHCFSQKKINFVFGIGYGKCNYSVLEKDFSPREPGSYPATYFASDLIRTEILLRYNIFELSKNHKLYCSIGSLLISNINAKWVWVYPDYYVHKKKFLPAGSFFIPVSIGFEYNDLPFKLSYEISYGYPIRTHLDNQFDFSNQHFASKTYKRMFGFNVGVSYMLNKD